MGLCGKAFRFLRKFGIRGSYLRLAGKEPAGSVDPCGWMGFLLDTEKVPFDRDAFDAHAGDERYTVNWVVPEPLKGSGGHTTIFRFASMLERQGLHNAIYYLDSTYPDDATAKRFAVENFAVLDGAVDVHANVKDMGFCHGVVATDWVSAYQVRDFDNAVSKFYFVQDFEPWFHPKGSMYSMAEATYEFGFHAITAGRWLAEVLRRDYGQVADSFDFSYDKDVYRGGSKEDGVPRVFFYARPHTSRRSFEVGVYALTELARLRPEVEVVFAGEDLTKYRIDIPRKRCLGVVAPSELAHWYRQSDICVVFSDTNVSLLPLEVMACGSVVACQKGDHCAWLINEDNAILLSRDPADIARTLARYLALPEELDRLRRNGVACAGATDWEREGRRVADIVKRDISGKVREIAAGR